LSRLDIRLIPPSETTDLSKSISEVLKIEPTETIIKKFANGET
jgi:phosphoribosylpyrophosphate synthetase